MQSALSGGRGLNWNPLPTGAPGRRAPWSPRPSPSSHVRAAHPSCLRAVMRTQPLLASSQGKRAPIARARARATLNNAPRACARNIARGLLRVM